MADFVVQAQLTHTFLWINFRLLQKHARAVFLCWILFYHSKARLSLLRKLVSLLWNTPYGCYETAFHCSKNCSQVTWGSTSIAFTLFLYFLFFCQSDVNLQRDMAMFLLLSGHFVHAYVWMCLSESEEFILFVFCCTTEMASGVRFTAAVAGFPVEVKNETSLFTTFLRTFEIRRTKSNRSPPVWCTRYATCSFGADIPESEFFCFPAFMVGYAQMSSVAWVCFQSKLFFILFSCGDVHRCVRVLSTVCCTYSFLITAVGADCCHPNTFSLLLPATPYYQPFYSFAHVIEGSGGVRWKTGVSRSATSWYGVHVLDYLITSKTWQQE